MSNYEKAYAMKDEIIGYRRRIHSFAEVGFELTNTRAFIKEKLTEFGYEDIQEIGGGLVTTVGKGGKTFLIRADMDALPMKEESGLEFAATNGNCHACGHDIHASMLLGVAKILKEMEGELQGTVKIMFQPAEELLTGAQKMVDAGVLENPKVDVAMMCHVNSAQPIGIALSASGPRSASSNNFRIKVSGKGAHGAMPENGIDPVYIGAQIVIGLQEMITREVSFIKSAVLTTGHFEAGSAANIIPSTALIEGTMRTFTASTQEHLKKRLPEIAESIAHTYRGTAEVTYTCDVPVFICEEKLTNDIHRYVNEFSKGRFEVTPAAPGTASEDFAVIAREVPTYMLGLGVMDPDAAVKYPLHNPKITFDENALPLGTSVFVECVTKWLAENC